MNHVEVKPTNRLDIDPVSAQNYITDMVSQLYDIANLAGLDHTATLLHATSMAISTRERIAKINRE
jgi:hypothetical protein